MRAEEFLSFLEKEKLKSIIYKRLKWKEGYVPKSSEEFVYAALKNDAKNTVSVRVKAPFSCLGVCDT